MVTVHKRSVCEGYVFTGVCLSTGEGDGIPASIVGGIPACLVAGLQGGSLSRHALQVSRPTPKGEVSRGILAGRVSRDPHHTVTLRADMVQPHTQGEVEGI